MQTETKILLLVFAGLVLVFLLYNQSEPFDSSIANTQPTSITSVESNDGEQYFPSKDYSPPESELTERKFNGRNKAAPNEYKKSNYKCAKRGALGPADWDTYFDDNNNIVGNSQSGDNAGFSPMDETNGEYAAYKKSGEEKCGSNQDCEPEDLFDVDKYLPQEVNDDWFEVQPEPISVKNRHLINITKPIGINTIGTSLKNASHDIRGSVGCPKFVVSPFLNSSIEPDNNIKPMV